MRDITILSFGEDIRRNEKSPEYPGSRLRTAPRFDRDAYDYDYAIRSEFSSAAYLRPRFDFSCLPCAHVNFGYDLVRRLELN
jgi:hypothetical protein